MKRIVVVTSMTMSFTVIGVAPAIAAPEPRIYECPGSNAHVWDKDQCPRIGTGFDVGAGGGGGGTGCNGVICRVIGGVLGVLGL